MPKSDTNALLVLSAPAPAVNSPVSGEHARRRCRLTEYDPCVIDIANILASIMLKSNGDFVMRPGQHHDHGYTFLASAVAVAFNKEVGETIRLIIDWS